MNHPAAPADTIALPLAPPVVVSALPQTARVLHVINGEHYSGAERVQDLLGGYLPACGYAAGFACVKPDRFPLARKFAAASG